LRNTKPSPPHTHNRPFLGIYFPLFIYFSTQLSVLLAATTSLSPELASILQTTLAGTLAGIFASAVTTPFDVINVLVKTKILRDAHTAEQLFSGHSRARPCISEGRESPDSRDTQEGWRALQRKGGGEGVTSRGRRLSEGLHKGGEQQRSVSALVLGTSERDISSERDMSESFNWWTAGDEQKKKNLHSMSKHTDSF